ncbi:MAG: UDP-glucose 4-epimerase GalE [Polyangiales bacterium]
MRVLVTGGAGYIGSVVVHELARVGHTPLVLDNLQQGHREALAAGVTFVQGDVADRPLVEKLLRDEQVEAVVHLAADSVVGQSVVDPARFYRNNVSGSLALLDSMRAAGVRAFVLSSTAAVYGEPKKQPIDEQADLAPTNPYGETKVAVERALRWYDGAYGLRSISLRYFNAAGAAEGLGERHHPETHLIPIVLQTAAAQRADVSIFGDDYPTPDGTCVRDYIHVVDLANAHVLALEALSRGAKTTAYNLGCGGDGYSVKQVIEVARAVTGAPIPTRMAPRREGDPAVLVASSARIQRELGWRPERQDLRVIVESAWRFMRSTAAAGK